MEDINKVRGGRMVPPKKSEVFPTGNIGKGVRKRDAISKLGGKTSQFAFRAASGAGMDKRAGATDRRMRT